MSFTTPGPAPIITNNAATNILSTSAYLNGDLIGTGAAPTEAWLFWGTNDAGENRTGWINTNYFVVQGAGPLTVHLTSLTNGTTYYYRYLASNIYGEVWATPLISFVAANAPAIKNTAPSNVWPVSVFMALEKWAWS